MKITELLSKAQGGQGAFLDKYLFSGILRIEVFHRNFLRRKSMNLPKQECVGEFCSVLSNLRRPSNECVGKYGPVKIIPLSPEVFPYLTQVGELAEQSGVRLRQLISS